MTATALATKVRIVPTESQSKRSFLAGLKSKAFLPLLAAAEGTGFLGRGFPPGPVCSGKGSRGVSLEAVIML